jgi:predicted regulator of Ras-like GTPase activity (Roadblock/LC7/MglB family)
VQDVLGQLNAVPGVIGSMVCGQDGEVLARAFPPAFDSTLAEAARTLSESAAGLAIVTGSVGLLDLRCANARIVARSIAGAHLLFLCSPGMNLQPLTISTRVVAPKLEKLVAARSAPSSAAGKQPAAPTGQLYATVGRINAVIERKRLDAFKVRGEIAMKAGFGLGFIDAETPDDAQKLSKLRAAASAVLGEPI